MDGFARSVGKAMALIKEEFPKTGLESGLLRTLLRIWERGQIRPSYSIPTVARYNGITRRIWLNPNKLVGLNHDFQEKLGRLEGKVSRRRLAKLESLGQMELYRLSGVLIHEGQHAFKPVRSILSPRRAMAQDEEAAFRAEQAWYLQLYHSQDEKWRPLIAELSLQAEMDSREACEYFGLAIKAPSLLPPASPELPHQAIAATEAIGP